MKYRSIFIAGTDTGVGKTLVTGLLAKYLSEEGCEVITQKWIQTGCRARSEDIDTHRELMGREVAPADEADAAPYVLEYPCSPHLAARMEGVEIVPERIMSSYMRLSGKCDMLLVEGSGGIMVPYSAGGLMLDIVKDLDLSVLLVAANRLGAINHTLLTIECLKSRGIEVLGVVFTRTSPGGDEKILTDNLDIVSSISGARILGEVPFSTDIDELYCRFRVIGGKVADKIKGLS